MESIFPFILAAAVAMFVWGICRVLFGGSDQRKRVSQRLSDDGKNFTSVGEHRSILIQTEQTALAKALAQKSYFQKVQQQLVVAWPSMTLSKFVIIATALALTVMHFHRERHARRVAASS